MQMILIPRNAHCVQLEKQLIFAQLTCQFISIFPMVHACVFSNSLLNQLEHLPGSLINTLDKNL